jgi:uncharacterized protein (TIGR02147 family)
MSAEWAPEIHQYLDFREYLRAYYDAAKQAVPAFSFRYFSRRAGFSSPNYLKMVMDGDRGLTEKSLNQMIKGLELDKDEARFFKALVGFNQATTVEEKNACFEQVAASRKFRSARRIDQSMFEYLSHWYYPAIREMAARPDFRADAGWIIANIFPPIKKSQAKEALALLFEMGLLVERDGAVVRGEPNLTTGHEVRSLAVGNYHRQMLSKGADSIETVPREHREVSGMTMCISGETFTEIKERIHAFRESLMELAERAEGGDPDRLYQLNLVFFPLSRWESDE